MPGSRPRIAVTCGHEDVFVQVIRTGFSINTPSATVGLDYTSGIEEGGGLPLVIAEPYRVRQGQAADAAAAAEAAAAEVLDTVDGVLITGGEDVDPEHFGESPIPAMGSIEPARDVFELALARLALARGVPYLGICRGIQMLAIAAGGTLYQDLAAQKKGDLLRHRQTPSPRYALTHFVKVEPGTLLAKLVGAGDLKVNSFHHQAVARVPEGFRVSATATDGVIEGLEAVGDGRFTIGVQWHPENLWYRNPEFLGLFKGLAEAARRYRQGAK